MKTQEACISCFLRQIEHTVGLLELSEVKKKKVFSVLIAKLLKFDLNRPSVVFGREIYSIISRVSGIKDIFAKHKIESERELLKCAGRFEDFIDKSGDPLHCSARFSCAANAIDFGAGWTPDIRKLLNEIKNIPLKVDHFKQFESRLKKANIVLFLGDNCGEAFFDRLFIERIAQKYPGLKIIYSVRSGPMINDATIVDAKRIGLDKAAEVISCGCDYPGLIFSETSKNFKAVYQKADIIISKGQGNFEAFSDPQKEVFYLFKSKCRTVSDYIGLPLNSLLFLYNRNSNVL